MSPPHGPCHPPIALVTPPIALVTPHAHLTTLGSLSTGAPVGRAQGAGFRLWGQLEVWGQLGERLPQRGVLRKEGTRVVTSWGPGRAPRGGVPMCGAPGGPLGSQVGYMVLLGVPWGCVTSMVAALRHSEWGCDTTARPHCAPMGLGHPVRPQRLPWCHHGARTLAL